MIEMPDNPLKYAWNTPKRFLTIPPKKVFDACQASFVKFLKRGQTEIITEQ